MKLYFHSLSVPSGHVCGLYLYLATNVVYLYILLKDIKFIVVYPLLVPAFLRVFEQT